MIDIVGSFVSDLVEIVNEMSPYLLLGFLFAGILHVFFPKKRVIKYMGSNNKSAIINASLIGIPLPLCSCGVIPTGISFYNHGASKGSTVSFLISTPQTGVDSVLVTYSLLGLPFALLRPLIALVTGFFGGLITNSIQKNEKPDNQRVNVNDSDAESITSDNRFKEVFRYAFLEFLQDISKYLVVGLLIAAIISVAIPDDFFAAKIDNDFLSMLIVLVAAIPVYICATASVPIAAVLMLKGLSPGAALVLLMAGPATNAATMTLINKVMGVKTLLSYLLTIVAGALLFGVLINQFLPRSWFLVPDLTSHELNHAHEILPAWLKFGSSILLILLIVNGYVQKRLESRRIKRDISETNSILKTNPMKARIIFVKGMTCSHCKQNVEEKIKSYEGINEATADLTTGKVVISGNQIDLNQIKSGIEGIGYDFQGETD